MEAGKLNKQTGYAGQLNVPGKADAIVLRCVQMPQALDWKLHL